MAGRGARVRGALAGAILVLAVGAGGAAFADEAAWTLLAKQPGHFAIMRHAKAPGVGEDPPGISVRDCAAQRNLDEEGRAQARRIGDAFRAHGIRSARVVSSQFCRCLETARLLKLGGVGELTALNYLNFNDLAKVEAMVQTVTKHLKGMAHRPLPVLVTHISNVKAITDVTPNSGEVVVVRFDAAGKLAVAGRIAPPN